MKQVYLDVNSRIELFGLIDFGREDAAELELALLEPLSKPPPPDRPHPFPQPLTTMDLQKLNYIEDLENISILYEKSLLMNYLQYENLYTYSKWH